MDSKTGDNMPLTEHDIHQITLIDEQINILLDKNTSDTIILDTLMDFIPEVCCMIEQTEISLLKPYLERYQGFSHFFSLVGDLRP